MQQGERRSGCVQEVGITPRREVGMRPETRSCATRSASVSLRPQLAPVRGPDHHRAVAGAESSPAQARMWRKRKDGPTLEHFVHLEGVETAYVTTGSALPIDGVAATFVSDAPGL